METILLITAIYLAQLAVMFFIMRYFICKQYEEKKRRIPFKKLFSMAKLFHIQLIYYVVKEFEDRTILIESMENLFQENGIIIPRAGYHTYMKTLVLELESMKRSSEGDVYFMAYTLSQWIEPFGYKITDIPLRAYPPPPKNTCGISQRPLTPEELKKKDKTIKEE